MTTPLLDPREKKFMSLLITGKSDIEIAPEMQLTPGTVRVYLHKLYRKIGVKNRTQAVIWYFTKNNPDIRRKKRA